MGRKHYDPLIGKPFVPKPKQPEDEEMPSGEGPWVDSNEESWDDRGQGPVEEEQRKRKR